MKILHTGDWHLGKKLHETDFEEDHKFFFNSLYNIIIEENIEVLVVAGDIFDFSNPPKSAEKLYYEFLIRLKETSCKNIIITAGNHDGIQSIEAPKEILKLLNVEVIGSISEHPDNDLIEIKNDNGDLKFVVAAVPFLRDRDLLKINSGKTYSDRMTEVSQGIINHYKSIAEAVDNKYGKEVPALATGHLFASGVEENSDAVRDIQIGNLAGIAASSLPERFGYIALGHIHRQQRLKGHPNTWYCGSPLPLSFTERNYEHSILVTSLNEEGIFEQPEKISIPTYRKLITINDDLISVIDKLNELDTEENKNNLVEVIITQEKSDLDIPHKMSSISEELKHIKLVKYRTNFTGVSELRKEEIPDLDQFSPKLIFESLIKSQNIEEDQIPIIKDLFNKTEEILNQEDQQ
ncbi:exonuclease SbcCD subunit D C-terminal domain-containing protein [Marinigracilibium pacificum]|uniref:Nuclease SbcCD subunit D n=1 Tax=Marinigracilibium pacificum TaxID=2729599 RepID=A0A848IXU5_9BACT|nr:exonuclease SbcCD subunit D C-terminal domain-containing protein [Marinigracilibium pacificum]NMM49117.1 exonuclease subunit SbcD [Marinigracilibium pacificum]